MDFRFSWSMSIGKHKAKGQEVSLLRDPHQASVLMNSRVQLTAGREQLIIFISGVRESNKVPILKSSFSTRNELNCSQILLGDIHIDVCQSPEKS